MQREKVPSDSDFLRHRREIGSEIVSPFALASAQRRRLARRGKGGDPAGRRRRAAGAHQCPPAGTWTSHKHGEPQRDPPRITLERFWILSELQNELNSITCNNVIRFKTFFLRTHLCQLFRTTWIQAILFSNCDCHPCAELIIIYKRCPQMVFRDTSEARVAAGCFAADARGLSGAWKPSA